MNFDISYLSIEFWEKTVGYDPNYNVSCRDAWRAYGSGYVISGFVTAVSSVRPIYTSCKPYGKG